MNPRFLFLLLALLVTACNGNVKRTLGIDHSTPDEFKVISNPPLSVPPEFTLRPPVPGAPPTTQIDTHEAAKESVFGQGAVTDPSVRSSSLPSSGEQILLERAGATTADPNIRDALQAEQRYQLEKQKEKGYVGKTLDFLRGSDTSKDPIVNPVKEKERITDNKAEGKPVTEGTVPVVEEKDRGVVGRTWDKIVK